MKEGMRVITASKDIQALVDKGFEVNNKWGELGKEDKAIKSKIKDFAEEKMEKHESSVAVSGSKATAVVTAEESYELLKSNGSFETVKQHAVDNGFLAKAVKRDVKLAVSLSAIEKAADILMAAGIEALVVETFNIDPKEFRLVRDANNLSNEEKEAQRALLKCAKRGVSFRLKYEETAE